MSKIRRLYSYKGEFIGLENYKYLRVLYDDNGEIKKPSKKTLINTSKNALMIGSLILLACINIGGGMIIVKNTMECMDFINSLDTKVLNEILR